MKNNLIRLGVLGSLIILCILQIIRLWLGDMSSHTFFTDIPQSVVVKPKEVWVNYNGLAYKIGSKSSESKLSLIYELSEAIKNRNYSVSEVKGMGYENLLKKEVFIYEYGTNLRFEEIFGYKSSNETIVKKGDSSDKLVIDLKGDLNEVYMLDAKDNINLVIKFSDNLILHNTIMEHYTNTDIVGETKTYQASILNKNYQTKFDNNVFYPLDNSNSPLKADKIKFEPIIKAEGEDRLDELKSSIDWIFKDPRSINISIVESGIVLNDGLDTNVYYDDYGYIEVNKRYIESATNFTARDDLKLVTEFIEDIDSISEEVKHGIYLKNIEKNLQTGEVRYGYGYRYNGFEVIMSNETQSNVGSPYFLEVGVRQSQITYAKWIMYDVVELDSNTTHLSSEGYVAISKLQTNYGIKDISSTPLSDMQCAYIIKDFDGDTVFDWILLHKGEWYY